MEHIDGMDIAAVDGALTKDKAVDDRSSVIGGAHEYRPSQVRQTIAGELRNGWDPAFPG